MQNLLNKFILMMFTVGLLAGCSSDESSAKRMFRATPTALYELDVEGKLENVSIHYQPPGSENVYIFNARSGALFRLHTGKGTLTAMAEMQPIARDNRLVGFTVEEDVQKVHFFYVDSVTTFSMNGERSSLINFGGLSGSGYIYPLDEGFLPIFKNGKMYAPYYPKLEDGSRNPDYFRRPVEAAVDFRSHKITLMGQIYPASYLENYYSFGTEPLRIEISENVHGYAFPQNDSIYIRDLRTGELETRFFGSRMQKNFEYIPYDQVNAVNATAFEEIGLKNPFYTIPYNFPLAGYFGRNLVIPPNEHKSDYSQYVVLFNRDFEYEGELLYPNAHMIDSKKGVLIMNCADNKLIIRKLSW